MDRDIVLLPEIFLESFDGDPAQWYRDVFDALWQSVRLSVQSKLRSGWHQDVKSIAQRHR